MRCAQCGGPVTTRTVPEYRNDKLIGLPGVVVVDAVEEHRCKRCGATAVGFENLAGLLAAAAVLRVLWPQKLSGVEIRALRKLLQWTHPVMAQKLGVREETISRWENGHELMNVPAEKYFRNLVGLHLTEQAPLVEWPPDALENMVIVPVRDAQKRAELRLRRYRAKHGRWAWEAEAA